MQLKNIAIIGPRGIVGSALIDELSKHPSSFNLTALPRSSSASYVPPPTNPHISIHPTDFTSPTSLATAFTNQDCILCCVPGGSTQFPYQKTLIDAAISAGVKVFFASEFISDPLSEAFAIFPTEVVGEKARARRYLEEKAQREEIGFMAVNGGPMFDLWLMKGPAGFDIKARTVNIYGTGKNLACWTPLPVIATAVVNMLRNAEPVLNHAVLVSGVEGVTQNAILAALEEEIGEKFTVEKVDIKKLKKEAMDALERGELKMAMRGLTLNSNFNEEDSKSNFWDQVENDLVGVKPVSVKEAVRDAMRGKYAL
ncbi:NAD(P)-binding protein [Aulographum hederae CBS 113979]|uniref:NAD(P)-binding protein n=1 Tax=Aulographum hederae CBS 113979 TaxID=1176131 RepID=A0A6G1GLQ8_9PEZI|nr:NAD(P)-binding protein [Aulographum hederae CBS 113979]